MERLSNTKLHNPISNEPHITDGRSPLCETLFEPLMNQSQEPMKTPDIKSKVKCCVEHPNEESCFICVEDRVLLCWRCLASGKKHTGHHIEKTQTWFNKVQTEINELEANINTACSETEKFLRELLIRLT